MVSSTITDFALAGLGLVYALALIDRTNLGIARIAGMGKDLVRLFISCWLPSLK